MPRIDRAHHRGVSGATVSPIPTPSVDDAGKERASSSRRPRRARQQHEAGGRDAAARRQRKPRAEPAASAPAQRLIAEMSSDQRQQRGAGRGRRCTPAPGSG